MALTGVGGFLVDYHVLHAAHPPRDVGQDVEVVGVSVQDVSPRVVGTLVPLGEYALEGVRREELEPSCLYLPTLKKPFALGCPWTRYRKDAGGKGTPPVCVLRSRSCRSVYQQRILM